MAATKPQTPKASKTQPSKAVKSAKNQASRVTKGHSSLKLYIHKDRISTTPMTAKPERVCLVCLREDGNCKKHVQAWNPRTPELVALVEAWLEEVDRQQKVTAAFERLVAEEKDEKRK